MKKFKFKLDTVLKYREILKNIQIGKLANAQRACRETEAYLENLDERKEKVYQSMIEGAKEGFSLIDHQNNETFNKMIIHEKSKEKVRLAKRTRALNYERDKLVRQAKDHKAIEKLEDKAKDLYKQEILSLEMKQIDDLVNGRFGLNKQE